MGSLINVTTENLRCIEKLPLQKLMYFAGRAPLFDVGFVASQSQKLINMRFLELELGSEIAPGYNRQLPLEDGCFCFGRGADFAGILWRSRRACRCRNGTNRGPKLREVLTPI